MTTHTSAPGRRGETHSGSRPVSAAVVTGAALFTGAAWAGVIAVDTLVIRGLCVAPRPTTD